MEGRGDEKYHAEPDMTVRLSIYHQYRSVGVESSNFGFKFTLHKRLECHKHIMALGPLFQRINPSVLNVEIDNN